VPTHPPQLPVRIPLRRPRATERSRRRTWALGISLAVHAIAIVVVLMARGGPERRARPLVEHATYVEIEWPRVVGTFDLPIPIASSPTSGGYGVATQPAPDTAATPDSGIAADAFDPSTTADASSEQADGPQSATSGAPDAPGRTRMGAGLGDARLIVTAPRGGGLPADDARYLAAFHAALRAFNDSVQGLADRESRASAWTWTDARGRVWGVRNGVIFIAGQPVGSAEIVGDRDQELAARRLSRAREEIDYHADRVQRERHLQERGRAVRERRDGERAGAAP
jgi:hypothetical protein